MKDMFGVLWDTIGLIGFCLILFWLVAIYKYFGAAANIINQ